MIKPSDIRISKNLFVAQSLIYNRKRRHLARDTAIIVNRSLNTFRKYLKLPDDVSVRVCSFKGRTSGRYWCEDNVVELSYSLPWSQTLEVLAHELVHAEQYHTGKLKKEWVTRKGWIHKWLGSTNYSKGSTYNAYRNQPWEIEAWDRQAKIAEQVCNDLEQEYEMVNNKRSGK